MNLFQWLSLGVNLSIITLAFGLFVYNFITQLKRYFTKTIEFQDQLSLAIIKYMFAFSFVITICTGFVMIQIHAFALCMTLLYTLMIRIDYNHIKQEVKPLH